MGKTSIAWPDVPCCRNPLDRDLGCACGTEERFLRAVCRGHAILTPEQRAWCLGEIAQVEGYDHADYLSDEDDAVARGVLSAWTDYARDKGLL